MAGSAVGVFIHLQRKSLIADALAHGMLPGICGAFLLISDKDNPMVLVGGGLASLVCYYLVEWAINNFYAKADAAIAATMSGFFGFGILLITFIQRNPTADSTGLDRILFGSAAAITQTDLLYIAIVSIPSIAYLVTFRKALMFQIFDPAFLSIAGVKLQTGRLLLNIITVSVVLLGVKSLGVILISSIIILPSAISSFVTDKGKTFFKLSITVGAVAGLVGVAFSTLIPRLSTGPVVVLSMGIVFGMALLVAPNAGVLSVYRNKVLHLRKVDVENALKVIYVHSLSGSSDTPIVDRAVARQLVNRMLVYDVAKLNLTSTGLTEARRVVRLHRLWEMYLSRKMDFATDHIHQDADAIEHIITPEIEADLIAALERPAHDPHQKEIPY